MSTSLSFHAFGIRGYDYVPTPYQDGQVTFTIAQDPHDCRCAVCGSREVISRGHAEGRFRSPPVGSRPTAIVLPIPRVECSTCDMRQVRRLWVGSDDQVSEAPLSLLKASSSPTVRSDACSQRQGRPLFG
jgi:hypothetical protein